MLVYKSLLFMEARLVFSQKVPSSLKIRLEAILRVSLNAQSKIDLDIELISEVY